MNSHFEASMGEDFVSYKDRTWILREILGNLGCCLYSDRIGSVAIPTKFELFNRCLADQRHICTNWHMLIFDDVSSAS